MIIRRLQVEEGFLDGLDLELKPGLNVLIGARGTGKTSVIELLRFALRAPAFTEQSEATALQHAVGVLAGGRVVVTTEDERGVLSVARQETDGDTDGNSSQPRITVLAQNELESIAGQAAGRLRLIDRLIPDLATHGQNQSRLGMELRSMTVELNALLTEGLQLTSSLDGLPSDQSELAVARAQQQQLLASVAATQEDEQGLLALQTAGARLATTSDLFERALSETSNFEQSIRDANRLPAFVETSSVEEGMDAVKQDLFAARDSLTAAESYVASAAARLRQLLTDNTQDRSAVEERVRAIRSRLEDLQAGASAITRRVALLEEREAQRLALLQRIDERRAAFRKLFDTRHLKYRELDEARAERYEMRKQRVEQLSDSLAPVVRVGLTRSAATDAYASAVIACLRGSGIHYRALAPLLAESMSPLELVEAAELGDAAAISDATGISSDRAAAVVSALRNADLETLIAVPIDDAVDLFLLDGSTYKPSNKLSIGQRCTVVLPILLAERGDVLVIDQPEDHLDNAFIVDTLVLGLLRRNPTDQVILSSHNANIPVLGEADLIVLMGSDGRRGFVVHSAGLDTPESVDAITRVLEGGREAFTRRADFYSATDT